MQDGPDQRPPIAVALEWVSKITTVALMMVLPGVGGTWLDQRWGTGFIGPLGFVFGLIAGMWQLLVITGSIGKRSDKERQQSTLPPKKQTPPPADKDLQQ